MNETTEMRRRGRCLCGAVRFTAAPAGGLHACHCENCRRMSGGVFLSVACDDVVVETPDDLGAFASSAWATRQFCRTCGSSLFWRMAEPAITMVSIQAFDDPSSFKFSREIYIESKPTYYDFAGDRPRLTEAEVMAAFAPPESL